MSTEDIRFSQYETPGMRLSRREGDIVEIYFENVRMGVHRHIVDKYGGIVDFPGLAHPDLVERYHKGYLGTQIRFRSEIRCLDGLYALLWQIQPDGRYWEDDDGFGGTSDDEIYLYARLDEAGVFLEPFRFYSIGSHRLYGTDEEDRIAQALASKGDPLKSLQRHVPEMMDEMRERIKGPEPGGVWYSVPGTVYEAGLTLAQEGFKWFVRASMRKADSDSSFVGWLKFLPLEEQRQYLQTEQAQQDAAQELTQLLYTIRQKD